VLIRLDEYGVPYAIICTQAGGGLGCGFWIEKAMCEIETWEYFINWFYPTHKAYLPMIGAI
jgi:hypothetical protein